MRLVRIIPDKLRSEFVSQLYELLKQIPVINDLLLLVWVLQAGAQSLRAAQLLVVSYLVFEKSDAVAPVDDQLDVLLKKSVKSERVVVPQRVCLDVSRAYTLFHPLNNSVVSYT